MSRGFEKEKEQTRKGLALLAVTREVEEVQLSKGVALEDVARRAKAASTSVLGTSLRQVIKSHHKSAIVEAQD